MNSILSCFLIVLLLLVINASCKQFPVKKDDLQAPTFNDSCIDLDKLKKFLEKKWRKSKFRVTKKSSGMRNKKRSSTSDNYTVESKIIGGKDYFVPVMHIDQSFFVGIHFKKHPESRAQCGGALLDPSWVLTSEKCLTSNMFAHVFDSNRHIRTPFVVATTDGSSKMGTKPVSRIKYICKTTDNFGVTWSDVVMARIEPKIKLKLYPNVTWTPTNQDKIISYGFGSTTFNDEKDEPHTNITKHFIAPVEKERCALLTTKRADFRNSFCAKGVGSFWDGNAKAKGHSCTNDAGGSMVTFHMESGFIIIRGIISNLDYERPCMTNHHWRLYSRSDVVKFAIHWILKMEIN